jgi:hypothetical protein
MSSRASGSALRARYYCKVLAAALARMRRYRSHRPHRSCGWFRQAKAAESLIAVPAFYFPALRARRARISASVIRRLRTSKLFRHSGMRHLAQARNPYSLSWLWIPGSRFARPGMTEAAAARSSQPLRARRTDRPNAIRCYGIGAAQRSLLFCALLAKSADYAPPMRPIVVTAFRP